MTDFPQLRSIWFRQWLELTGGGESPKIFNFWTGASCIAACLGRRFTTQVGRFTYAPNMYVILTGPPAVRKSSAGDIAQKLLRKYTDVKFGPNDTAGQRQGLISSFVNNYTVPDNSDDDDDDEPHGSPKMMSMDDFFAAPLANSTEQTKQSKTAAKINSRRVRLADGSFPPSDLFVFADELGTFIGMNQLELVNCLTDIYYPKDNYEYALARQTISIPEPGLNLLACTTPTSLTTHLPPTAIGQGFSSRAIFVYCGTPGAKVFPAPPLDEGLMALAGETMRQLHSVISRKMHITNAAMETLGQIYNTYKPSIDDNRFIHYEQRRLDHLIKLAMVFTAVKMSDTVTDDEVLDAHEILIYTEATMSHALGELGMSKLALAKQHLKDMIEASHPHGLSLTTIKMNLSRDMLARDINETLQEFENKGFCVITEAGSDKGNKYTIVVPVMAGSKPKKKTAHIHQAVEPSAMRTAPMPFISQERLAAVSVSKDPMADFFAKPATTTLTTGDYHD